MTHTPGPWTVDEWDDSPCVKYPVEDLDGWQHWIPSNHYYLNGSCKDDARLIAAAPEMLEALKAAKELMEEEDLTIGAGFAGIYSKVCVAIEKAIST